MIRVVLDANIVVRAVIKPNGTVGPVLKHLRDGDYRCLYSDPTIDELVDVLHRPRLRAKYHLTDTDIETVLMLVMLRGEPIQAKGLLRVCRDPKDDKYLELATAGRADVLVTGDDDLLVLHPFEGIPIVSPSAFLAMLQQDLDSTAE